MSVYWEDTLDQSYNNLRREVKRVGKIMLKIKSIEITISLIEGKLYELKKRSKGANVEMIGI